MNSVENKPWQLPGGVGKSGGIDPLVEDLAYRKFEEELVDTVIAALRKEDIMRLYKWLEDMNFMKIIQKVDFTRFYSVGDYHTDEKFEV